MMMIGTLMLPLTFLILGATNWSLWISTALMGTQLFGGAGGDLAATAMLVGPSRLGTAYGLVNVLQNVGLAVCNMAAGWLNDAAGAGPENPAGFDRDVVVFRVLGFVAFGFVALLWRRELGPFGRGLEARSDGFVCSAFGALSPADDLPRRNP